MRDAAYFDAVLAEMEGLGLLRSPRRIVDGDEKGAAIIEGEACIAGHGVTLRFVLPPSFPLTLPRIFLRPWDALGIIPHVDMRGVVCFADAEGLVLDRSVPVEIIREAIERAVSTLSKGARGENTGDFADEFEAYWAQLPDLVPARSFLDAGDTVVEVTVGIKEKQIWIARHQDDVAAYYNGADIGDALTLQKALYLPLIPGACIVPPHPQRPFWSPEDARRILLPALSDANRTRLRKLTKRRKRLKDYVVVRLPRPSGGATLFGIRYDDLGNTHPLADGGTARRLVPLHLQRLDRRYLIRRGGGDAALGAKRVLIVGCGAVGGHLAFELARAGVLHLTIMDPDTLSADNTFRHALGRRYWGKFKVDALKEEIEAELPYVRVRSVAEKIEHTLARGEISLSDYDLIVVAIGNPTVELEVNERIHALSHAPAIVFTWLEPLGIGGHALLAANGADGGCFACLYTSPEGDIDHSTNRAAFAAPGQEFGRKLSGCASLHTPYGSVDAVRTAALAARLAVDALTGRESGNPLRSWKGDARAFEEEGFAVSRRYGFHEEELYRHRYMHRNAGCRVCGDRATGVRA